MIKFKQKKTLLIFEKKLVVASWVLELSKILG